jgi:hypothetical protein
MPQGLEPIGPNVFPSGARIFLVIGVIHAYINAIQDSLKAIEEKLK